MNRRETSKTIDIEGTTYTIHDLSPLDGSWIVLLARTKLLPAIFGFVPPEGAPPLTRSEYQEVQAMLLGCCHVAVAPNSPPVPVFANGRLLPELAHDLSTVHKLILAAFGFVTGPFFEEASKELAELQAASTDSSQQPAT